MARIRTIKPEFFTSLTIADLTPEQRLTFIGLWTHVDDEGRCVDDPRLIKAAVWPLDDRTASDIEIDLKALTESSLITRYVLARKRYLAITNWYEHQRINRPTESKLPAPEDGDPLPPDPPSTGLSPFSVSAHGGLSERSNEAALASPERSANGARQGGAPEFADGGQNDVWQADFHAASEPLTSEYGDRQHDSLRTHTQLTEDSPQERKGKEGNREGKGTPLPPEPEPAREPAVVQTGRALPDRMTDSFLRRFAQGNAYGKRQVRRVIVDTLENGTDPDELWAALTRLGDMSKPVTPGTLQFAFSEIRQAAATAASNVVHLPTGQTLTGTDAKVAGWAAIAAKFASEDSEDSA
jgi:hypothetical protein